MRPVPYLDWAAVRDTLARYAFHKYVGRVLQVGCDFSSVYIISLFIHSSVRMQLQTNLLDPIALKYVYLCLMLTELEPWLLLGGAILCTITRSRSVYIHPTSTHSSTYDFPDRKSVV